jgi:hypothetical protein
MQKRRVQSAKPAAKPAKPEKFVVRPLKRAYEQNRFDKRIADADEFKRMGLL